jgi:hypothetical protein
MAATPPLLSPASKFAWTLVRRAGETREEFSASLRDSFQESVLAALPSAIDIAVTIQEFGAYENALLSGESIDAVVEVISSESYPELDAVNTLLKSLSFAFQGWRVNPTVIYDVRPSIDIDATWPEPTTTVFIQRIDGTSPEHFDSNWYKHAGYPTDQAAQPIHRQIKRDRLEEDGPFTVYRQNRVVEPITPVEWVIHGYTQLQIAGLMATYPDTPYERWRHEDPFDQWPPRVVQGFERKVL